MIATRVEPEELLARQSKHRSRSKIENEKVKNRKKAFRERQELVEFPGKVVCSMTIDDWLGLGEGLCSSLEEGPEYRLCIMEIIVHDVHQE